MSSTELMQKEQEIQRLNQELARKNASSHDSAKYKKALRELEKIIKANQVLKEQVDKLRRSRAADVEHSHHIQFEELRKAYQKLLREKNQLGISNQNLQLNKEKLRFNVQHLEQVVSQLKSDQLSMARQKQALERDLHKKDHNQERPNDSRSYPPEEVKEQIALLKQKQAEYHRTISNYEEHHANLNRTIRQQQQTINELQSELAKIDAKWKVTLQAKELQIHDTRIQIRREFQEQAGVLKKQNGGLRAKISDLTLKVQALEIQSTTVGSTSDQQQEMELLYTLRELKAQMDPMRVQIADLQDTNQFQKEENIRQKTALKMRVMELEAELYQQQENGKNLQHKLLAAQEKERNFQDQERLIKKLEQQNRMLGGRVIVLESKDVALRNRTGEQLEERVLEFQTRVEMLLSEKENLSSIKNVSIHQLIALKAYIMELDGKLRSLVNENEYSNKKYKNYKEKYTSLLKEVKTHEGVINSYKNKIFGYDKLVLKLQQELERAMNLYDAQIVSSTSKITQQQTTTTIEIHKRRFSALKEKLDLQEKYSKQELETIKLNYQTKIMEASIRLQQLEQLRETVDLYKIKNQELNSKLNQKDNQILEAKLGAGSTSLKPIVNEDNLTSTKHSKELISSLHLTISSKEQLILQLENEFHKSEEEWRRKCNILEKEKQNVKQMLEKPNSPAARSQEAKIFELEQDVRRYKAKIADLQTESMNSALRSNNFDGSTAESRAQQFATKISELQLDLDQANGKMEALQGTKRRLEQQLRETKEQNQTLENTLHQQQREAREKIQQYISSISNRDDEMRTQSLQINSSFSDVCHKLSQEQSKNHRITLQLESLKTELIKYEDSNRKLTEKSNDLTLKFDDLKFKHQILNDQKERSELNNSRLETRKRQLEQELRDKEDQLMRLQSDQYSLKAQVDSFTTIEKRVTFFDGEIDQRDRTINRLNQQVSRLQHQNTKIYQQDATVTQLRGEVNRLKHNHSAENEQLSTQLKIYQHQIYTLKSNMSTMNVNLSTREEQVESQSSQLSRLNQEVITLRADNLKQEQQILDLENRLQRTTMENNRNIEGLQDANEIINERDSSITRLKNENRQLSFLRDEHQQLKTNYEHKEKLLNKVSNDMQALQIQFQSANVEDKQMWINKLQGQLNSVKNDFSNEILMLEHRVKQKDQQITRLIYESTMAKQEALQNSNRISQLEQQVWKTRQEITQITEEYHRVDMDNTEKDRTISRMNYDISQLNDQIQEKQITTQHLETQLKSSKSQLIQIRNQAEEYFSQTGDKDQALNRINYEMSFLKESIGGLEAQIEQKDQIISRLNNEISELRMEGNQHFDIVSEKENKISNLNFEYTQLKGRFEFLQEETKMRQNSWTQVNQELYKVQMSLNQSQEEIQNRNSTINRLRTEINSLKSELQIMNSDFSNKNIEISRLNQELFKRSMEDDVRTKEEVQRLTQELSTARFEATNLRYELETREDTIEHLRGQVRQSQKLIPTEMVYSEEQYSRIKEETVRLQREITNLRGELVDKDFNIGQLENQIQFNARSFQDEKNNYDEQVRLMQTEIENLIQRERKITQETSSMHGNDKMDEMKFGLKMYQDQIDRLNRIVTELKEQLQNLRLKTMQMRNQEDRIQENLTTMVLTFAEVEALRDRIKLKQNEISEVRKSLISIGHMKSSAIDILNKSSHSHKKGEQGFEQYREVQSGHIDEWKMESQRLEERQRHLEDRQRQLQERHTGSKKEIEGREVDDSKQYSPQRVISREQSAAHLGMGDIIYSSQAVPQGESSQIHRTIIIEHERRQSHHSNVHIIQGPQNQAGHYVQVRTQYIQSPPGHPHPNMVQQNIPAPMAQRPIQQSQTFHQNQRHQPHIVYQSQHIPLQHSGSNSQMHSSGRMQGSGHHSQSSGRIHQGPPGQVLRHLQGQQQYQTHQSYHMQPQGPHLIQSPIVSPEYRQPSPAQHQHEQFR